ncbi:cytochrome d ubiquinol oxidase subunit II [Mariniluteicoccus endophyticus]
MLTNIWFLLIAVLWIGYFVLEGFDFGVGMLNMILGRKEEDRRVMINTIGPVWDGNEVWLLTAGGATFAAFPEWYATLFSGLYLPLFLVLLALIVRGVAFEYRHKRESAGWRSGWDWCIFLGSFIPALVLGVGFANFVSGMPIVKMEGRRWVMETSVGNFLGLFMPFALIGGLLFVALFLFHGAVYISLKTKGDIRERSRDFAGKVGLAAVGLMAVFTVWQSVAYGKGINWLTTAVAVVCLTGAWFMNGKGREGIAFVLSCAAILALIAGDFISMFPNAITATDVANNMPLTEATSSPYTLRIMTIAACVFVPIVLAYQSWTFWVFRKRISTKNLPAEEVSFEATQA